MNESDIWKLIMNHRAQVLARDRETLRRLTIEWLKIEQILSQQMISVSEEAIRTAAASGLTLDQLRVRAESLSRQLFARISEYGDVVTDVVTDEQRRMILLAGLQVESELSAIGASFNVLAFDVFENMVGHVAGGSPLFNYFMSGGMPNETMNAISDALIKGVGLGRSPTVTAKIMMDAASLPYKRALTIARTETLRVYRIATMANYAESDIVDGWAWLAKKGSRTCLACLAKDGSIHGLDEEFNDHPDGRCTSVPTIGGKPLATWETGREWFAKQSPDVQQRMMGQKRYAAWKGKRIAFDDLAQAHHNQVFGTHYGESSLEQALANAARRRMA